MKTGFLLLSPFILPSFLRRDEKRGKNHQLVIHLYTQNYLPIFIQSHILVSLNILCKSLIFFLKKKKLIKIPTVLVLL